MAEREEQMAMIFELARRMRRSRLSKYMCDIELKMINLEDGEKVWKFL